MTQFFPSLFLEKKEDEIGLCVHMYHMREHIEKFYRGLDFLNKDYIFSANKINFLNERRKNSDSTWWVEKKENWAILTHTLHFDCVFQKEKKIRFIYSLSLSFSI